MFRMTGNVGPYIREWREYRGLTLVQLGELSGMHHSTLSKIERGKRRWNTETLNKIATALAVTPAMLLSSLPPSAGEAIQDIATLWAQLTTEQREVVLQLIKYLQSI